VQFNHAEHQTTGLGANGVPANAGNDCLGLDDASTALLDAIPTATLDA
jgi:hypothetical protein